MVLHIGVVILNLNWVLIIFHNLRGYDSHLIMQEIGTFVVKVNVTPNGLEKCMAFTNNNNLVFIDSMQFINPNLDSLVNNLSDNDFKHLLQDFSGNLLELVKEIGVTHRNVWAVLKSFLGINYLMGVNFLLLWKMNALLMNALHPINVWNVFKMNKIGDYHDLYLKTDVLLLEVY